MITPNIIKFSDPELKQNPPAIADAAKSKVMKLGLIGVYCKKLTIKAESSIKNLAFKEE
jgi:hypothetical protein